jgi:DNA-binding PadR family transcriptional regulator
MSTRLVILGLLRSRPLHGYEIKRVIEEHMGDWTSIAFGSIYFALQKLVEEEAIEILATEKAGGRPSRTVYSITEKGRDEFVTLLRGAWKTFERHSFAVDLGLFFFEGLPANEIHGLLHDRVATLTETLRLFESHRSEVTQDPKVPPQSEAIFEHASKHLLAELSWTKDVLAAIESRRLRPGPLNATPEGHREAT